MPKLIIRFFCVLALSVLSACSTIKQWFPDKEKDYQYTTEIPELVLPPDLKNEQFPSLPLAASTSITAAAPVTEPPRTEPDASLQQGQINKTAIDTPAESNAIAAPAPETEIATVEPVVDESSTNNPGNAPPAAKPTPLTVDRIKSQDHESLRIHAPFTRAWRAVDKALSRKSIEVTSRDITEKQFAVRYDPSEMEIQDSSFWDEWDFIFFGLKGNEKAYLLKINDGGQWADVTIFDSEGQAATDAGAVGLMQLLEETIKTDFSR